jgi:hypothetical protein
VKMRLKHELVLNYFLKLLNTNEIKINFPPKKERGVNNYNIVQNNV